MASAYGFNVSVNGVGSHAFNVGTNGATFGVANNSSQTVLYLLTYANSKSNGALFGANVPKMNAAYAVFNAVDLAGGIS
jgi:hypothetical protein